MSLMMMILFCQYRYQTILGEQQGDETHSGGGTFSIYCSGLKLKLFDKESHY